MLTCRKPISLFLLIVLSIGLVAPMSVAYAAPNTLIDPLTIGGLIVLGKVISGEVQNVINTAGSQAQAFLEQANKDILQFIDTLDKTYKDNLNITINSLDDLTKAKILEIKGLLEQVDSVIQSSVGAITGAALTVLQNVSLQLQTSVKALAQSLQDVIIVGGETAAYVIDVTFYNVVLVIALIFLGVGLLLFIGKLLDRDKPLRGLTLILVLVFMFAYLGGFGVLVAVPSVRAQVMQYLGVGLKDRLTKVVDQPEIIAVLPPTVVLGKDSEFKIAGYALLPQGKTPKVTLGTRAATPVAQGDREIVIGIVGYPAPSSPSVGIELSYDGLTTRPRAVVQMITPTPVQTPPDLAITDMTFSTKTADVNSNLTVTITIRNLGQMQSASSILHFRAQSGNTGGQVISIPSLSGNGTSTQQFTFAYSAPGDYDVVAVVDSVQGELNSANNSRSDRISVLVPVSTNSFSTAAPTHYCTAPFGCGDKGTDLFNSGSSAGTSCTITAITLDLLDSSGNAVRTVPPFFPASVSGAFGTSWGGTITEAHTNTSNYTVKVDWWYDIGFANRQRVNYTVTGRSCAGPSGTVSTTKR